MTFDRIGAQLYLGEEPQTRDDYHQLIERFGLVLAFNHARDRSATRIMQITGDAAATKLLERDLKQATTTFRHFYIDDDTGAGALDEYRKALRTFRRFRLRSPKQSVYVHCKNGMHRSAHFVIFLFMVAGLSYDEAFAFVRAHRPVIEVRPVLKTALEHFFSPLA